MRDPIVTTSCNDLALSAQEAVAAQPEVLLPGIANTKRAPLGEEDLISNQPSMLDIPMKHQNTPKIHSGVVVILMV